MPPAVGLRRSAVVLAIALTLALSTVLAGCGAGPKKKVASAESEKFDEPMTKWESAGETMPPEKAPEKPPEKPAAPDPAKSATATASAGPPPRGASSKPAPMKKVTPPKKDAARKPTPVRKGGGASGPSVAAATSTSGNADEDDALLKPVLTIDSIAGVPATAPSAAVAPSSTSSTATPHATVGAPASKVATVPITPEPARKVEPAPPPPPAPSPPVARVEPPSPPPPKAEPPPSKPEPPHEKAMVTREPIREKAPAARVVEEERPRELHATIGGKTIVFRDGVILGNRRHGYAIQAFELPGSTKEAEVDVTIEAVDLKKRKALPVKLIYLRILDDGPQSSKGVRELMCRGRGELVLDSVPPLPKKLPQDALDVGDAAGSMALEVSCMRDSLELGSFTIQGRVLFRVLVIPADM